MGGGGGEVAVRSCHVKYFCSAENPNGESSAMLANVVFVRNKYSIKFD